jgi:hypothetical protein
MHPGLSLSLSLFPRGNPLSFLQTCKYKREGRYEERGETFKRKKEIEFAHFAVLKAQNFSILK